MRKEVAQVSAAHALWQVAYEKLCCCAALVTGLAPGRSGLVPQCALTPGTMLGKSVGTSGKQALPM